MLKNFPPLGTRVKILRSTPVSLAGEIGTLDWVPEKCDRELPSDIFFVLVRQLLVKTSRDNLIYADEP